MASDKQDQKPEILEKMRQEPLSEAEVDELRASGRGFEREAQDPPEVRRARGGNPSGGMRGDEGVAAHTERMHRAEEDVESVARRAHGGNEQHASHRALNAREGSGTRTVAESSDESSIARRRAEGRFETEGERTQVEEDFGERGLRMPDHADNTHTPSILDPEVE